MNSPKSNPISSFTFTETYQFFLSVNDVTVLDEVLQYYISIENLNATSALKVLFKEKSLRN
ncbi:MAG: hypothetical protein JWQ40_3186 [Segetibacter sp.]|nr:hypothetical protein [Segetibacter sp.]